jgi:hypothetical protein
MELHHPPKISRKSERLIWKVSLALGIGLIAAFAASSRRWFLRQMDARLSDRDAGDADAVRRLHWGGMLSNAVQVAAIVASIPYIAVAP